MKTSGFKLCLYVFLGWFFLKSEFVLIPTASAAEPNVIFFSNTNFRGLRSTYILGSHCMNVNAVENDQHSSLDTQGHCIEICEHTFCRGQCKEITQPLSDLSNLGFNDAVSSVKLCNGLRHR